MPKAERELCIKLLPEDKNPQGDQVGKLSRMMYGLRDVSNRWMRGWQPLLKEDDFAVGQPSGALFLNQVRRLRGAVHGDDFFVLGVRKQLDEVGKLLASKYSDRGKHRLGFGSHCCREAVILNKIASAG